MVKEFASMIGDNDTLSPIFDHGMLNKNKPILTCMLLHTNESGDQRYWFACNIPYQSKSREDTIQALNKTLIEDCRLKSQNFCTGVVDGALIHCLDNNITIGTKNCPLLWDPPHLIYRSRHRVKMVISYNFDFIQTCRLANIVSNR